MQFAGWAERKHYLGGSIAEAVRLLLSTKHLYQHVAVEPTVEGLAGRPPRVIRYVPREDLRVMWWPEVTDPRTRTPSGAAGLPGLRFEVPSVKLFCSECVRVEAYNPLRSAAHSEPYPESFGPQRGAEETAQVFVLHYQCQSCRGTPETFLIRRDGLKLTLCGRSPIEHVDVPTDTPRDQREFYQSAVIAYQCGHTLEGLFMLRTFIEQFAYEKHPPEEAENDRSHAERALESYMDSLPCKFKRQFPSLRALYGDLSVALHEARPDAELFERVRADLDKHFSARRVFDLASG